MTRRTGALALLGLSMLALALLPAASADQNIQQGPLSLTTLNTGTGDCSQLGTTSRDLTATVAPDANSANTLMVHDQCDHYQGFDWEYSGQWFFVQGSHCSYNSCVSASWSWYANSWQSQNQGYASCSSSLWLSGINVYTGCPTPDGSGPPMLPALP